MRSVWLTLVITTIILLPFNSVLASEENSNEEIKSIEKAQNENSDIIDNTDKINIMSADIDNSKNDEIISKEVTEKDENTNKDIDNTDKDKTNESYKLIVQFINEEGVKIKDDLYFEKDNNEPYNIEIPSIDDYVFVDSNKPLSGIIKSDTIIVLNYKVDETIDLDDNISKKQRAPIKDESEEVITDGTFLSFVASNDIDDTGFTNPDTIDNFDLYLGLLFITFNLVFPLLITKRYYL